MNKVLVCCLMFFMSVIPAMPLDGVGVVLKESHKNDQQKSDRDAKREAAIKEKAELLGLEKDVIISMRGFPPTYLRGIIENISVDSLGFKVGDQIQQIKYSQIDKLRLAKRKYKAKGQVDPVAIRLIVVDLAKDKEAKLKLASDTKIKGRILSFGSDSFTIWDTDTYRMERILFSEVTEIQEAKMPIWKKVLIGVGVGIFGAFIIFIAGATSD